MAKNGLGSVWAMEMKWAVTVCVALMRDGTSGFGDIDDGEAMVRYVDGQVG